MPVVVPHTTTTTTRSSRRLRLGVAKKEEDNKNDDDDDRSSCGKEGGEDEDDDNDGLLPVSSTARSKRRLKLEDNNNSKINTNTAQQSSARSTTRSSYTRTNCAVITPPALDTEKTMSSKVKKRTWSSSPAAVTTTRNTVVGAAAKRQATTLTSNSNANATAASEATASQPNNVNTKAAAVPPPPKGWEDIYSLVIELRQDRTAPCDISGCEALAAGADHAETTTTTTTAPSSSPQEFRLRTLIALMLSSQTKDAIVGEAVRNMIQDGVLNISALRHMSPERLCNHYLSHVGFRNNKTRFIKETVQILHDQYQNDIPPTAALMMEQLPGVGPKMAFICESVAWNIQSGIGVDTHMHRIFNLLHWVKQPCKTPEHTRKQLEAWLPHKYWADVNILWVGFGQEVQQEKAKLLRKALVCSRPTEALRLLKRCGLDYNKEAQKLNLQDKVQQALLAKK